MLSFPIGLPPTLVYSFGAFGESVHGGNGDEEFNNSFWVMNGISAGSGVLCIENKQILFSKGSVLFIPPNTPHLYHFEGLVTKTWAHFRMPATDQLVPIPEEQNLGARYKWYYSSIQCCKDWVLTEPEHAIASLWLMFWQMKAGPVGGSSPRWHPVVKAFVNYLETHLGSLMDIEPLAKKLDVSPAHLNRLCQSAFGLSTAKYIQRIRLERAVHLLSHTKQSISEIAYLVGYPDLQHFNKLIRSYTGLSPRKLRSGYCYNKN